MPTVRDFYNSFNFQDMVLGNSAGEPPQLLKTFFEQDFTYINTRLEKDKNVLEVGCGFGRLLPALSAHSKTVTGIDFSDLQLSQAKDLMAALNNVKILQMKAEAMEFDDASFDISLCMNCTLGNMPNIEEKVVREMIRVTKPGGEIVIRVFADTEEVRLAQHENYKRLGLSDIKDEGMAVITKEGFYSRRFNEDALHVLFEDTGVVPTIRKDCEAGYLIEATR